MGFEFPRVTHCCFCIPLRIACLLIGYISMIVSCVVIAFLSFYIYKIADYVKYLEKHPDPKHPPDQVHRVSVSLYVSLAYFMLVFLYNFVINLLLVIGVHQNKSRLLRYYLNTAYFLLAFAITLIIISFVFMGFLATLPTLKWAVTIVFCIMIVRSMYLDMEERNRPKTYEMHNLHAPQQAPLMV